MLEIKSLTKIYDSKNGESKKAVDNLTLSIDGGQIMAFIGHNGAGKTTTLKAIAGIIDFDEGQILIDGIDIKKDPMKAKMEIAYLPDNPQLFEHLRGIEQINFICDVFGVSEKERKAKTEFYAKRLGIYDDLGGKISTYSHGMKQKLAIVCALVHNPKVLLMDEPFVGLDPVSSHELKEILKEKSSAGVAIFYSTHVLEVAEKLCSHVAIIKNGKLLCSGKMDEVRGNKDLEQLFLEMENEKNDN